MRSGNRLPPLLTAMSDIWAQALLGWFFKGMPGQGAWQWFAMQLLDWIGLKGPGCACVGTFAGILEKLDYLTTVGVNALELQPVHEFNELEYHGVRASSALTAQGLQTYWSSRLQQSAGAVPL